MSGKLIPDKAMIGTGPESLHWPPIYSVGMSGAFKITGYKYWNKVTRRAFE